jgi:hypothetical protein
MGERLVDIFQFIINNANKSQQAELSRITGIALVEAGDIPDSQTNINILTLAVKRILGSEPPRAGDLKPKKRSARTLRNVNRSSL